MKQHTAAYIAAGLEAAMSKAIDELYARALCAIETRGRVPATTPAEAEAYITGAVNAAALRLGISPEAIAEADRAATEATGWHGTPAYC